MRAVSGFSQELFQKYQSRLDNQGQHYITRILAGTERMPETGSPSASGAVRRAHLQQTFVGPLGQPSPGPKTLGVWAGCPARNGGFHTEPAARRPRVERGVR